MAWKHLYSTSSPDHGTLAYFRGKLNRVSVSKEPKKSVDACIEFLDTVMKGHWLGCACEVLGITGLDEPFVIPPSILKGTPAQKLTFVRAIAEVVVNKMTLVELP